MSSKHYHIFACDLDDTLLKSDKSISSYDIFMLNKLQSSGIHVVFSSGFVSPFIMYPFLSTLKEEFVHLSLNYLTVADSEPMILM